MKFEVINDKNKVVMHTESMSCIPNREIVESMITSGYKFKVDNKILTKKKIIDLIKENKEK